MQIRSVLSAGAATVALLSGASAAVAGGYVAPVVEPEPVVVAPISVTNWAGTYAGGSLGYSFGGDDVIGVDADEESGFSLGSVDIKGAAAGLHVGYRWQRGNWVFGPELGIEGGSVDASDSVLYEGDSYDVVSELNHIITLVLKTGYVLNPQTLVYGTFGAARGDFDYSASTDGFSQTIGYNSTGLAAGLGVERLVNANTSVFAEYQYRDFGRETLTFGEGAEAVDTVATPKHSNIKVGVNFRF